MAIQSARNYRFLRNRGIAIRSSVDYLIATVCIEQDFSLLHNDSDFEPFEMHLGLKIVHPEALAN